jgi:8-oxo-dGTP diphosphatase
MITKAALLLFRNHNGEHQLLFVRATGKPHYVFPGGKQEVGETIEQALARELDEELATEATDVKKLGEVTGTTPDGRPLTIHLYSGKLTGTPEAHSEIEELRWFTKAEAAQQKSVMTPMTLDHVFPFLDQEKLW